MMLVIQQSKTALVKGKSAGRVCVTCPHTLLSDFTMGSMPYIQMQLSTKAHKLMAKLQHLAVAWTRVDQPKMTEFLG